MLYLETGDGEFEPWKGQEIDGVLHPLEIEKFWTAEELAAVGLFSPERVVKASKDDLRETGDVTVSRKNGVVQLETVTRKVTVSELRQDMLERLDVRRWEAETGGIWVDNVEYRTDEVSQSRIMGIYVYASLHPEWSVGSWEGTPGEFTELSNEQILALGDALVAHVQRTFDRKRELMAEILAATTLKQLMSIDMDFGWYVTEIEETSEKIK